jgi:phosphatidylinositol alpha 1,6-mannosyltransferase
VKDPRPRVAYFPDSYLELDGVARTSREFEEFARRRDLPLLLVHGGPYDDVSSSGSVTRVQLRRSWMRFSLDHAHDYDLIFLRRLRKVRRLVHEFRPDVVQITGPSDVGIVGALIADSSGIPLAATWQTNLPQYARSRVAAATSFLPAAMTSKFLGAIEKLSLGACVRFYQIPQLLFAPNPEIVSMLEKATGKPCLLMGHAADTDIFSPKFRTRNGGPLRIGYAGRLSTEKNVAAFVRLERELLARGHRDFRIVMIGEGTQESWLRKNLQQAEFTGRLTGAELSQAFANLDILAFPSETDTLGLVVLEALASGVPAVVTDRGGPRFVVRHGRSGYVASTFEEFVSFTETLLIQPELIAKMRIAARKQTLAVTWDGIFEEMYGNYERHLNAPPAMSQPVLSAATG